MDYEIPAEYTHLWKYLANAYASETFKATMPSDSEIIRHYNSDEKRHSSFINRMIVSIGDQRTMTTSG